MNKNNQSEIMNKRLLSLKEACNYINIKQATMYNYLNKDKIKAFKIEGSRSWKFDIKDLDQWIDTQKGAING